MSKIITCTDPVELRKAADIRTENEVRKLMEAYEAGDDESSSLLCFELPDGYILGKIRDDDLSQAVNCIQQIQHVRFYALICSEKMANCVKQITAHN